MFLILNVESGGFLKWERINQNNLNFWYINSLETLFKWLNFQIGTLYIETAEHLLARLEIYIVYGFLWLQSKHSTSQCNVQTRTCCGRRRKHWIEVYFQSIYFYIDYIDFIIKYIKYIYASLLNLMSCIDLYLIEKLILQLYFSLYSLRKHIVK